MSSSSSECLKLEVLEHKTPFTPSACVGLACLSEWRDELLSLIDGKLAAAVRPEAVGSKLHAYTAAVTAYAALLRGQAISRRPGLNIALYLAASRSIRDVVERVTAKPRAKAVLITVAPECESVKALVEELTASVGTSTCCFDPISACKLLTGGHRACSDSETAVSYLVSRTALFAATRHGV